MKVGNFAIPTLSKFFFQRAKIQQIGGIEYYYDTEILKKYNFVSDNITRGKSIVLLDDDCWRHASNEEISQMLSALKKIIGVNFSKSEVLFKRHPNPQMHTKNFSSVYGDYLEYPYYIPADFIFFKENIKFVIGGYSNTLRTASKYYNLKSISYLKLIPFRDENLKNQLIEILRVELDNKIGFPDSWEELNSLLSGNFIN